MAETHVWLQPGQSARYDIRLKKRGEVRISVVDGNDVPVENANIRVQLTEHEFPARHYEGTINGPGTQPLVFPAVFEGPFSVNVSATFSPAGPPTPPLPPTPP